MDECHIRREIQNTIIRARCGMSFSNPTWVFLSQTIVKFTEIVKGLDVDVDASFCDSDEVHDDAEIDGNVDWFSSESGDSIFKMRFSKGGVSVTYVSRAEDFSEALRRMVENHLLIRVKPIIDSMKADVVIMGHSVLESPKRTVEERFEAFRDGIFDSINHMELRTEFFKKRLERLTKENNLMVSIHLERCEWYPYGISSQSFIVSYSALLIDLISDKTLVSEHCTVVEDGQEIALMRGFRRIIEYLVGMPMLLREGGYSMGERGDWDEHHGPLFTRIERGQIQIRI